MILLYYLYLTSRYKGVTNWGIRLSKANILSLFILELCFFLLLLLNFKLTKDPLMADSFAYRYMFIYPRGVLPLILLSSISDRLFHFGDPQIICFIVVIATDYIALRVFSSMFKTSPPQSDSN